MPSSGGGHQEILPLFPPRGAAGNFPLPRGPGPGPPGGFPPPPRVSEFPPPFGGKNVFLKPTRGPPPPRGTPGDPPRGGVSMAERRSPQAKCARPVGGKFPGRPPPGASPKVRRRRTWAPSHTQLPVLPGVMWPCSSSTRPPPGLRGGGVQRRLPRTRRQPAGGGQQLTDARRRGRLGVRHPAVDQVERAARRAADDQGTGSPFARRLREQAAGRRGRRGLHGGS